MKQIYGGILGLATGDAVGVPVEFKARDSFCVTDMTGYGTHGQPAGTWSDDTSMALATLESIGRCGCIDTTDIMENFIRWYRDASFTAHDEVFDIGNTTANALRKFLHGTAPEECGGKAINDNGNGSLMRILPLAFVDHTPEDIRRVSALTHAHPISVQACQIYVKYAQQLLAGVDKREALRVTENGWRAEFARLPELETCTRAEISSGGYVVHTLEAALWCLLKTENYRDCVLTAVNLGSDTDTTGAVAGGLAGIYYGIGGEKGIPEAWLDKLAAMQQIKDIIEKADTAISG